MMRFEKEDEEMNWIRIYASACAGTVVFFIYGFLVHGVLIAGDYQPYPVGVFRSAEGQQSHMPVGMAGILMAVLAFATLYAMICGDKSKPGKGAAVGSLVGVLMAGAHAGTNFATLQISGRLGLEMAISAMVEWTLVGVVVGMMYHPRSS